MRLDRWKRRVRYWLSHRRRSAWLREEMEFHLAQKAQELKEAGMPDKDAHSEARRQFGNVTHKWEESRAVWIARWTADLIQDVLFASRTFRKQPGFTAAAVLSAALGVGACSTIFAVINFVLLRPLPVEAPSRLMAISAVEPTDGIAGSSISYPDVKDLRQSESFQDVAAYDLLFTAGIGADAGEPKRYWGQLVTANYFDVVRPRFALGRGFVASRDDTPGQAPAVVMSNRLWKDRFGADPAIVGQTIQLNGRKVTVAGVTTAGFGGTEVALQADFWIPLSMIGEMHGSPGIDLITNRNAGWLFAVGRLRDGTTPAKPAAELRVIAARLRSQYPVSGPRREFHVETAGQVSPRLRSTISVLLVLLLGVTVLVLLTACANVANLLLARNSARHREIATRLAMGAGKARIFRQLLTESVLLAAAGSACGYLIARWGASAIGNFHLPIPLPINLSVPADSHVVWFCLGLSAVTGLVFGVIPALRAIKPELVNALKQAPDRGSVIRRFGLRNLLVVSQVAMCMLLLISVGLFFRSLHASQNVATGMRNRNVFLLSFDPSLSRRTDAESRQFMRNMVEAVETLPGVESASLTTFMPLSFGGGNSIVSSEDGASGVISADFFDVAPRFFETLGIDLQAGQDFDNSVGASKDLAVVNQRLAERLFPGQNPVGRLLRYDDRVLRIAGLVATAKSRTVSEEPTACIYLPLLDDFSGGATGVTMLVRTQGDPAAYATPIRQAVRRLDPDLALFDERTIETHLENALILPRAAATLFGLCGSMGLLITIIGLYGVVSIAVARRTREIGVRMALGARRGQVLAMVLRHGLLLTLAGCSLGAAAAFAVGHVAGSLLYGVRPSDPVTFVLAPLFLVAVSLVACFVPARRAASLDPADTLRWE